jgi:hypothetical protein
MTTELFDRTPSPGNQLARQFDRQAKKIRGVYFPDLDRIPMAAKDARVASLSFARAAPDCPISVTLADWGENSTGDLNASPGKVANFRSS